MKRIILANLCVALFTATAFAGDLNPPAGPVAPTPGPEPRIAINATNTPGDADSVFRITQPGSYYLTGNVTGVAFKSGIEIGTSQVTIDLMGFRLAGVATSLDGITTSLGVDQITVRNGTVADWGGAGIDLIEGGVGAGFLVESVLVEQSGGVGIVTGFAAVIRDCTSSFNVSHGYSNFSHGVYESCVAHSNGGSGFSAGFAAVTRGCAAGTNGGNGFILNSLSTVSECTATNNGIDGIVVPSGSTVVNCTAGSNTGDGIQVSASCIVTGNTCNGNGAGAGVGAGVHSIGLDNRIDGNHVTGADVGIDIGGFGNLIIRNTAATNTINYVIAANNRYGPIIDISAAGGAAVNGSAAADNTGTTHPWANFTH